MSNDWTDVVPTAVKAPLYVYKYRHKIQEYWAKLQVEINLGKTNVLVTGAAGSGKSVLASSFHGEANQLKWVAPDSSRDVEIKPITMGNWTKVVSIIPGQDIKERSKGLDEAFNSHNSLEGVIHVVDWGFTATRNATSKDVLIQNGIDTIDKLREVHLNNELKEFKVICDHIAHAYANNRGPKWFIIAVNKVDLYLDKIGDAKGYYHPSSNSKFIDILNDLLKKVGSSNLKCAVQPVSSMPTSFEWNGVEMISQIKNVEQQRVFLREFIDIVAHLANENKK